MEIEVQEFVEEQPIEEAEVNEEEQPIEPEEDEEHQVHFRFYHFLDNAEEDDGYAFVEEDPDHGYESEYESYFEILPDEIIPEDEGFEEEPIGFGIPELVIEGIENWIVEEMLYPPPQPPAPWAYIVLRSREALEARRLAGLPQNFNEFCAAPEHVRWAHYHFHRKWGAIESRRN